MTLLLHRYVLFVAILCALGVVYLVLSPRELRRAQATRIDVAVGGLLFGSALAASVLAFGWGLGVFVLIVGAGGFFADPGKTPRTAGEHRP